MTQAVLQKASNQIKRVLDYIHQHLDQPLNRSLLAQIAGFSVPHFHRLFTAATGESVWHYIRRLRLERAARKLRMGATDIGEVAFAAGYATHAAFSKAFKEQYGLSPSAFRQLPCQAATIGLMKGAAGENSTV